MSRRSAHAPTTAHAAGRGSGGRRYASIGRWARVGVLAQVVFVVSWIVAASWQGSRYSVRTDTISDMYAVGAPRGGFLVVVFTLCGAATIAFALRSVWPALRPGGWRAGTGSVLLALSVFGLGDLLSAGERLACRTADPGCTTSRQVSNAGGRLDDTLSSVGVVVLVVAAFFLAAAMRRTAGWERWARPTRWTAVVITLVAVADVPAQHADLGGLAERLLAAVGAGALAALALGVLRHRGGGSGLAAGSRR